MRSIFSYFKKKPRLQTSGARHIGVAPHIKLVLEGKGKK